MTWLQVALAAPGLPASDERACPAVTADDQASYRATFDQSRGLFLRGCHREALDGFEQLQRRAQDDPNAPAGLVDDSAIYLAEVHYVLGDRQASLGAIEGVLQRNVRYRISVLDHDPDFVEFFRFVRSTYRKTPSAEQPPEIPALPWRGYMPFGIPQFHQGRSGAGASFLTAQLVTGAASAGLFIWLVLLPDEQDDTKKFNQLQAIRVTQLAATASFFGLWLASHLEARSHWRRSHRERVLGGVVFDDRGRPQAVLFGTF